MVSFSLCNIPICPTSCYFSLSQKMKKKIPKQNKIKQKQKNLAKQTKEKAMESVLCWPTGLGPALECGWINTVTPN